MSDPRDNDLYRTDLNTRGTRGLSRGPGSGSTWGWIAGAVFVLVLLAIVFGYGVNNNTASNNTSPPPATTGAGTTAPAAPKPAAPTPPASSTPANPSNGGQAR